MDDDQDLGPATTIRCVCGRDMTLREMRGETGSYGGARIRLGAVDWYYECPAGHRETLAAAEARRKQDAGEGA